jgi:hypothetical protein
VRRWFVSAANDGARRALTRNGDGTASAPLAHVLDLLHKQGDQGASGAYDDLDVGDHPFYRLEGRGRLVDALRDTGAM